MEVKPKQFSFVISINVDDDPTDTLDYVRRKIEAQYQDVAYIAVKVTGYSTPLFEYTSLSVIDSINNISMAIDDGNYDVALALLNNVRSSIGGTEIPTLETLSKVLTLYEELGINQ